MIDFTWFLFIGVTKLRLTPEQTGRLTLTMFHKLYAHYKNDFDLEMRLKNANVTYSEAFLKSQKAEEWL